MSHQSSILSFFGKRDNSKMNDDTIIPNKKKKNSTVVYSDDEDELSSNDAKDNSERSFKKSQDQKLTKIMIDNAQVYTDEEISKEIPKLSEDIAEDMDDNKEKINVFLVSVYSDDYDPSKENYQVNRDTAWKKSSKIEYSFLAKTFSYIEDYSSRLKIIEILANFLWSVKETNPKDLLPSIYLCLNKISPEYEGLELGIGDFIIIKAIAQATGRTVDKIKNDLEKEGDLGIVAEKSRNKQRLMMQPKKLTISDVFKNLKEISQMKGQASSSKKIDKIQSMLVACRNEESRFLVRSLSGKLRIGLAEQSLLAALAQCCILSDEKKLKRNGEKFKERLDEVTIIIKEAYSQCPNYDKIVDVILKKGVDKLPKYCQLCPGIPVKPMLAHPTRGIEEIMKRFDKFDFSCEHKYDGERAQIHVKNDDVYIYSRNQENNTEKYPDVISNIFKSFKREIESCILDCEAVAWDKEKKQILPFQVLSTRKRKDVKEDDIRIQVCLFAFDLMYINGESLIKKSFRERRNFLKRHFKEIDGNFMFARSVDVKNIEEIQVALDESIKGKCEGLMVKSLDHNSTYEIAKRSHNWLKLKKDYLDGIGDSLDLVVIGAYFGKGKRTGSYGAFLLACYDDGEEEYQSICKIGTGFKDEDLDKHYDFFKRNLIKKPKSYYNFDESFKPDVWFDTVQVWEIKCADLSISPAYKAAVGLVDPSKGISLRFPRFIRIREDKDPEDATCASDIADMYNNQEQIKKSE